MIDAHIHAVNPNLPGLTADGSLWESEAGAASEQLRSAMLAAGVTHALAMGLLSDNLLDPLGVASTLELTHSVPGLFAIGAINPLLASDQYARRVEAALQDKRIKALKCYLGYTYFGPEDPVYAPYYRLAARHNIPVVFHTGDSYSRMSKVKYAHPLRVDEVAVDNPDVKFVLAHFGNPWLMDAAEVIYKNDNVWADLSALVVGDENWFEGAGQTGLLRRTTDRVIQAFEYTERPDRFVFGTDWPLSPINHYADFIRALVPDDYHTMVLTDNARTLFDL